MYGSPASVKSVLVTVTVNLLALFLVIVCVLTVEPEPSGSNDGSSGKCPTYLPKNSIKSLCKGCDVDKI